MNSFLQNLHQFFTDPLKHHLQKKIIFAPGTAPMRKENSEVADILFATDFDSAYFVDPVYGVAGKDSPLQWDIAVIQKIDARFRLQDSQGSITITFNHENKKREITFIAGDATFSRFQPKKFTIFFSGKRIGLYPGFGLRGTPSEYLQEIIKRLPVGGYVVPDRALLDDTIFFPIPFQELGLKEIPRIREPIPKAEFPKGYSEDAKFIHSEVAQGVGLYRKVFSI